MNSAPGRLPSRPLRNWLLAWHIHTGDPGDVIAKGFDLDPILVADLLSGEAPLMIERGDASAICIRLRLAPEALWSPMAATQLDWPHDVDAATSEIPNSLLRTLGGVR